VQQVLPRVYWALLAVEAVGLTAFVALVQPTASHPGSILLGWGAIASMVVMLVYSVARRSKTLRDWLRLSAWLHLHIFLGLQGVLWAVFHSVPLVHRGHVQILNPGVLNLLAVVVIFASGVFGRYLYSWLPRSLGGEVMAGKEIDAEIAAAGLKLPAEVEALWKGAPRGGGLGALVRADRETRAAVAAVRALKLAPEVEALALRRVWLERRRAALETANRWFSTWIVLHRPIAAIMYVLTVVHVLLAYMFSPALAR
jgi:hypothetical protein